MFGLALEGLAFQRQPEPSTTAALIAVSPRKGGLTASFARR